MFETHFCADHFKIAVMKPVYKSGYKKLPENYRPISLVSNLLNFFGKPFKTRFLDTVLIKI